MVRLRKLTKEEFERYKAYSIQDYAKDLVHSGNATNETALQSAMNEFNQILPNGLETPCNYMYVVMTEEEEAIGFIWYGNSSYGEEMAFIFDVFILEPYRNNGYGTETISEVEKEAKLRGYKKMGLNVFRFNEGAHSLYVRCGYKAFEQFEGNIHMEKDIES